MTIITLNSISDQFKKKSYPSQPQFSADFLKIINHTNEASYGKHAEGFLAASYFCNRNTVCSFNHYTEQLHADMGSVSLPSVTEEIAEVILRHQLRNPWEGTA